MGARPCLEYCLIAHSDWRSLLDGVSTQGRPDKNREARLQLGKNMTVLENQSAIMTGQKVSLILQLGN